MNSWFEKLSSADLWIKLFLDPVFIFGAILLFISGIGLLLLLKLLQKQSETSEMVETPMQPQVQAPTQIEPQTHPPAVSLENLSSHLSKVEALLKDLSKDINQMQNVLKKENKNDQSGLKEELKLIIENIKMPQGSTEGGEEVKLLAAKVDKIYQVLVTLSESAERL